MSFILKLMPALVLWAIFAYVILQVPYPDTLTQANILQILGFFVPLFLAITFTINFLLKNILSSVSVSLGIIILLILKALDSLNIVTSILLIISVGLFVSYFKKIKGKGPSINSGFKNLTKLPKISRLTHWRKQKQ